MNNFLSFLRKSYIYIILILIYIPLIFIVILSFTQASDKGNISDSFSFDGGQNYLKLFTNDDFVNALVNTIVISVIVVPISTIIAVLTCFGIWNSKKVYQSGVLSSSKINIVNPDVITGISLALLFSSTWIAIGLNLGFFTVILSHISFCTPYAIIVIYPRMQKMNHNLILASYDLGYNKLATFFKVTIPFLLPAIISGAAIVFAMSFDDFIITNLTRGRVTTISTQLYAMRKGIKAWAVTFGAIIIMITLFIMGMVALHHKYLDKRNIKGKRQDKLRVWNKQGLK